MNALNNILSGVRLPEARFEVTFEQNSLTRLAVTVFVTATMIMIVGLIIKKVGKNG